MITRKNISFGEGEHLNLNGGKVGALFSTDKKNKLKEIVYLKTEDDEHIYYNPTTIPKSNIIKFNNLWMNSKGDINWG